jgi:hypothetical protein
MNRMTNKDMLMSLLAMKYSLEKSKKDITGHVSRIDESIRVLEVMLQRLEIEKYTEQTYIDTKQLKKKGIV